MGRKILQCAILLLAQGLRSSDDESPVEHPELSGQAGLQRPYSRLAGDVPRGASTKSQNSNVGPFSYEPPPPGQ